MLCCCTVQYFYFVILYCVLLCCSLLLFATVPLSGTVVQFLQFWKLHFTSLHSTSICASASSAWQLVLYFILLCFFQRFWSFSSFWNYLCQSHLVALFCCMFWLSWTSSSQWTIEGHEHQVSWRWWPGHKPVTTGTLSWWSEKYRFEGKHSHPFAHLFYTSLNVQTNVKLGVKTKLQSVNKDIGSMVWVPPWLRDNCLFTVAGCVMLSAGPQLPGVHARLCASSSSSMSLFPSSFLRPWEGHVEYVGFGCLTAKGQLSPLC